MSKCSKLSLAALAAAIALPFAARAQVARPDFSLVTGETIAPGAGMIYGQFGWPSASFGYQHGLNEKFDAGIRFDLLYGYEATTSTQFGISIAAPLRTTVLRRDKVSLMLHLTPLFQVHTSNPAVFAIGFPVGGLLGVQVSNDVRIGIGADMNMKVAFASGYDATFIFSPMFGPAIEFYVDRQLAISLDTRFGPVIFTRGGGSDFGFRTMVGVAYRL